MPLHERPAVIAALTLLVLGQLSLIVWSAAPAPPRAARINRLVRLVALGVLVALVGITLLVADLAGVTVGTI